MTTAKHANDTAEVAEEASSPGAPRNGQSRERISLTIDPDLLRRVDQRAKSRGMSRSSAIADALSDWLAEDERRRG